MNNFLNRLAPAMALSLALPVFAQQASDPADARTAGPQLRYQSAFADYKPWQDIKVGDWRRLNDNLAPTAAADGGHAGHSSTAPAAPASLPASGPGVPAHQGDQMNGGKP